VRVAVAVVGQVSQGPLVDWSWIWGHTDDIATRLLLHIRLTAIAVSLGFAISLLLSLLVVRWRRLYGLVASVAGILYTIPSLALFGVLVTITGGTTTTAEIALVSYTLLILIRNIVAGLDGVPRDVREAAVGMGFSPRQVLFKVDFPLALPVIVAGLRIATVTTIGLVTIAATINVDNLGTFITEGLGRFFMTEVLLGAVLAIALAVAADVALLSVQRLVAPWSRRIAAAGR
jgi:osmoprotectant transport system permease protein